MNVHFLAAVQVSLLTLIAAQDLCPSFCTCEIAALVDLPINSVLVKAQFKKDQDNEEPLPSYQSRNEVMDERDEHVTEHSPGEDQLKAATCLLQPENNLLPFLSLPPDLQVLMILHGPTKTNITLDETYFEHLQMLIVLEIHGFPQGEGVLRLRKSALKHLGNLQYINFQHLHLLGDPSTGNQPLPMSVVQFGEGKTMPRAVHFTSRESEEESNTTPGEIQFIQHQSEVEIVPYRTYLKQLEQAGFSTFAGLQSLVFLRAFHCNIKEVNWEMFIGLENLKYLSLEGNKIPFINDFSFYGTPNLKHLTLSHNKLLSIHSTALAGLLELEILDLSYNNISHLSELSLPPLPKLISSDFHHNPLEEILPHTFEVMNSTRNLFLGGKLAKLEIRHNSFLGLKKLQKLSLTGLYLEVLEREYFKGLYALKELRIEGTIHEVSFDAFAEIPKLQELIMKHCSIKQISMDAFFGLYNLMHLDLSHNHLEMLPPALFDHQKSLKEVILSNNKLTTLPEGLFVHIPAKLIRLDKNPWHCTCSLIEWQPSQINKIKVKTMDKSQCQTRYDKSSMCKIHYMYQYKYEQSVSPQCASPSRFSGRSVFHILRKHLRCQEKLDKAKVQEKKRPKVNNHISVNLQNVTNGNSQLNFKKVADTSSSTEWSKTQTEEGRKVGPSTQSVETSTASEEGSTVLQHSEQKTESYPNRITSGQTTQRLEATESKNTSVTRVEDNQDMWTKKDKDKYKHFEDKYERTMKKLNTTTAADTLKVMPEHTKDITDVPSKTKKQHDLHKKWEIKMENTMRRLNMNVGNVGQEKRNEHE